MLNTKFLYQDAIESLDKYSDVISIKSLPTTVFLMQQDVINYIEYCSKYALAKVLDDSFLEKLGSEDSLKYWVREFNDQSTALYASLRNLICYTNRLLHDSKLKKYNEDNEYDEYMRIRNEYISIMTDLTYQGAFIGVFATEEKQLIVFSVGAPKEYDPDKKYQRMQKHSFSVEDRRAVQNLYDELAKESQELIPLSKQYGGLCEKYSANNEIMSPVYEVSKTWWL